MRPNSTMSSIADRRTGRHLCAVPRLGSVARSFARIPGPLRAGIWMRSWSTMNRRMSSARAGSRWVPYGSSRRARSLTLWYSWIRARSGSSEGAVELLRICLNRASNDQLSLAVAELQPCDPVRFPWLIESAWRHIRERQSDTCGAGPTWLDIHPASCHDRSRGGA
jgi:hypothetical protein